MNESITLPVRGQSATEILTNDHQVIKRLLHELVTATERTERKQILEQLKAALTIHNATEENLVYPALDKVAGKLLETQRLYHETAGADITIFELDTMLKEGDDADFGKKAEKLQDAIEKHIEHEEHSAFPHLQKKADSRESQMLTESVRKFRSELRYEPAGARTSEIGEV
jgi:hemerythrin superfamily protein